LSYLLLEDDTGHLLLEHGGRILLEEGTSLLCRYSTSDASTLFPVWTDATELVRSFSVIRGRSSELEEMEAGTASIVLDNRTRTFDPIIDTGIRPMNRWWLCAQVAGENEDIFKGWAESYQQVWPDDSEPLTIVSCADEFKVLALDRLPVTSPPRDSYAEVVLSDSPNAYWQAHDFQQRQATVGPELTIDQGATYSATIGDSGPIVGEIINGWFGPLTSTQGVFAPPFDENSGGAGNAAGLLEFTIETWFRTGDSTPASTRFMIAGGTVSSVINWELVLNTSGQVVFNVRNNSSTLHAVGSSALTADTWYHIVGTIDGGNARIYTNGVQSASTAWTGTVLGPQDAGARFSVFGAVEEFEFDEIAFYPAGLSASRILAHYQAGRERGFAGNVASGTRVNAILDQAESIAGRRIDVGVRNMPAVLMRGQPPLDELRQAARAEAPDGMLFISRSGEIVLLDANHRSSSPYNTVQATFDDDGTDLPYQDLDVDFSEAFLFNEWHGSSVLPPTWTSGGGELQTASDATSIASFGKRAQSLTSIPVLSATNVDAILDAWLAKTKDPFTRILSITLSTALQDVAEAAVQRDLGDRIRVFRTPPGGGTRIDQTLFIQSIRVTAQPGQPWQIVWGVSPL
jgi:Concanavalin A-like lectin/glucanases superfamily